MQAHADTISIHKNRIAAQIKEMAEQNALITESSEKQRSMYNDHQAVRVEIHESQNLKDELLQRNIEIPRLGAEL